MVFMDISLSCQLLTSEERWTKAVGCILNNKNFRPGRPESGMDRPKLLFSNDSCNDEFKEHKVVNRNRTRFLQMTLSGK